MILLYKPWRCGPILDIGNTEAPSLDRRSVGGCLFPPNGADVDAGVSLLGLGDFSLGFSVGLLLQRRGRSGSLGIVRMNS